VKLYSQGNKEGGGCETGEGGQEEIEVTRDNRTEL